VAQYDGIEDAIFEKMLHSLLAHTQALLADENFSSHSNHGVLQPWRRSAARRGSELREGTG
jgi:hypothetical protein